MPDLLHFLIPLLKKISQKINKKQKYDSSKTLYIKILAIDIFHYFFQHFFL